MKLSVIFSSRYALFSMLGMIALPVHADIILNDYTDSSEPAIDTNLILNGDVAGPTGFSSWSATKDGDYSLTGSGTISQCYFSISTSEPATASFSIESGVNLSGTIIDVAGVGTSASYAGTVLGGTTEKSRFGVFDGAVFDLRGATFEDNALVSFRFSAGGSGEGGTIRADYTVNAFHNLSLGCTTVNFNTLDGNLVLADSGIVTFYHWAGETAARYLDITGKVTITGETLFKFNTLNGNHQIPTDGTILMTCSDLEGNPSQFKLQAQNNVGSDTYEDLTGYSIKSTIYGDSYALYLAADSSQPGDTTPPSPMVILEGSVPDGILGKDYTIEVSDGKTVDASGSTETTLDGSAISGAGTLVTNSDQTILITSNQELTYSVSGTDETTPGASVEFGTDGGSLTSQMSSIAGAAGQTLNLQRMSVKSGIVDNKSTVTSAEVISVGSNSGSAALNNYGTLSAGQGILVNSTSSMDNRGIINGDITVTTGATVANNSTVQGTITVEKGGLLKGSGTATSATISGTLNVGNSPGFQRYESLTLNNGSQLIFTVDGSTPATLTRYGEGTYSQINVTTPGGLTVNGTSTAQVVFTSNAVLGTLQSGSMTLPLTLITVNNGEGKPVDATTTAGITYSVGGELANFITLDASSGALVADLNSAAVIVGMGGSARDLANTLWSSTMVVNSFARQASAQISPARRLSTGEQKDGMAVWGAGLGDFTNVSGADGFTYSGGGYAVGVDGTLNGNLRGGIAFGQQWGTFKSDARGTKVDQDSTMVGLYGGYSGSSNKLDYQITGYAAYGTTDNDGRTSLGGIATGRSGWDSDTATWGLKGEMAYRYSDRASVGAFIGLDYLYGSMGSFTELYDAGLYRNVSDGAMQVWRMPIGITWKGEYSLGGSQYILPAISLAYVGDISRTNPHVSTETLGMQGRAKGSDIGRNAFLLNAGATWLISDQWSASAAYNLEVRSGQTAQSINAGVRYAF